MNVNIHKKENEDKLKQLAQLPDSCAASADCLERQRAVFEQYHVFSPAMIDGIISKLRSYEDRTLRSRDTRQSGGDAETGREVFPLRVTDRTDIIVKNSLPDGCR